VRADAIARKQARLAARRAVRDLAFRRHALALLDRGLRLRMRDDAPTAASSRSKAQPGLHALAERRDARRKASARYDDVRRLRPGAVSLSRKLDAGDARDSSCRKIESLRS
jgi:hypothetical protein